MSKLPALEKILLCEVGLLLHRYGFSKKPVDQSFRLSKPFGWASIHLAFVRHPPTDFDVVVNVSIRIDAVQEMIQEKSSLITSADRRNSATIGVELGNLRGEGQRRWTVASDEDVGPVASEIVTACETTLLPFVDRYSDLGSVLEALTKDERTARLISPIAEKREKTVIALSKLLDTRPAG